MRPPRGTPANIHICLIFLEIRIIDLQFAGDSMCLGSLTFSDGLRKTIFFRRSAFRPISSEATAWSYIAPFRGHCRFLCSWPHPYSTLFWGMFPLEQIAPVGVNVNRYLKLYIQPWNNSMYMYSNLCENYTSTSQTGRQTDRRLSVA